VSSLFGALQLVMPNLPVVVKIGHAHSGMGKVGVSSLISQSLGVDLTGLLGGHKRRLGSKLFVKLRIIFALQYNRQQLFLLLDKINLA